MDCMDCIKKQGERFESSLILVRGDLGDIKSDIGYVRQRCDEIDQRCGRLKEDYEQLSGSVGSIKDHMSQVAKEKDDNTKEIHKMKKQISKLEIGLTNANEEIDRLESFSRRDNLRLFGVPPVTDKKEDYDDCADAVLKVLNKSDLGEERVWSVSDIERAHRVGPSKDKEPRTMIVKFANWRDKLSLLKDKSKRENLQKETGVRLANDLTRRQSAVVAEARREGKVAFFRNGKLQVQPRRPDPGTYAGLAGAERRSDSTTTATGRHDNQRSPPRDSPSRDSSSRVNVSDPVSSRRSPARGSQDSAASLSSCQAGGSPSDPVFSRRPSTRDSRDTRSPVPGQQRVTRSVTSDTRQRQPSVREAWGKTRTRVRDGRT